jgi:hypothetical protein
LVDVQDSCRLRLADSEAHRSGGPFERVRTQDTGIVTQGRGCVNDLEAKGRAPSARASRILFLIRETCTLAD